MLMRARSIRLSIHPDSELPFKWDSALRTVFGPLFGPFFGVGASRLARADAAAVALAQVQPEPGEEGPKDGSAGPNPGEETVYEPELSGPDGVPEDMATMVLNGPPLGGGSAIQPGAGSALRPGATPEERAALRAVLITWQQSTTGR
jgi:hypothetical protein